MDQKSIQNIRKRIQSIKKCFDEIDEEEVEIGFEPVKDFEDKSNYPIDFQIFMEEFGEMLIKRPEWDSLVLNLEKPKPLVGLSDLYSWESWIVVLADWAHDDDFCDCKAQDVKIIANDVESMLYGFDTSKPPYRFLDHNAGVERNFLDWFVRFINIDVLDNENLFSKTGIKLKHLK